MISNVFLKVRSVVLFSLIMLGVIVSLQNVWSNDDANANDRRERCLNILH